MTVVHCWHPDGCERRLKVKPDESGSRWWHCPDHGRMRRLGKWYSDHETFTHTSPAVIEAVFEPKGDRG